MTSPSSAKNRPANGNATRNLRVAILGTSNSLMRDGYVIGLGQNPGIKIVANVSLGSSHSPMLAYRLPDLEHVDFDILILDLCVNEQRAIYRNLYDLGISTDVFNYVIDWCGRKRVTPVALILPDQHCFSPPSKQPRANEAHDHYVRMCKKQHVPYFDGRRFIKSLAKSSGTGPVNLFKDVNHLAPETAQLLGKRLGNRINALMGNPIVRWSIVRSHTYTYIPVPLENTIERKTSIATVRFARMKQDSNLTITCPPRCHVVAVALNMSQTNAALKISGDGELIKRFDNAYHDPSRSMWFVIWCLLNPVNTGIGDIHLSVTPSSLTSDQEDNDHSRPNMLPPADQESVVEVSGIILRTPSRWRVRTRIKHRIINLLMRIPKSGHRGAKLSYGGESRERGN